MSEMVRKNVPKENCQFEDNNDLEDYRVSVFILPSIDSYMVTLCLPPKNRSFPVSVTLVCGT